MDRFSPLAPARVRVLVLPVGEIERTRYLAFLNRLKDEASIIKLADIESHVSREDELYSPRSFSHGCLLFDYTTSIPTEQQLQLSPFEIFREPLLVLGIKDGFNGEDEADEDELVGAREYLRERHPRVVHRQLLVLRDDEGSLPENVAGILNAEQSHDSALKEAIHKICAQFLIELATYIRALHASPSIQTPGQTARRLQTATASMSNERRPTSSHTSTQSVSMSSPIDDRPKTTPVDRNSPASSFDQITNTTNSPSRTPRPDSRSSNPSRQGARPSSQDRVSVQGFGSSTSQEKLKSRGKARVGIVVGSVYMMAGQWSEALRILTENTNKARILTDHAWHAKGLENIVVCMLLHVWAGLEFQIPSVCFSTGDRTASGHSQRFSVNLPSDTQIGDLTQEANLRKLSSGLMDLSKLILSLYRSGEGALELPFVPIAEATLRLTKLMVTIRNSSGQLNRNVVQRLFGMQGDENEAMTTPTRSTASASISKAAIAEMLAQAHPISDDGVPTVDQVAILSGMVSGYTMLDMKRKKASVVKDLMMKLTGALIQARKRGAAEMGIHPATSLSADAGADELFGIADAGDGLHHLMAEVATIYGCPSLESQTSTTHSTTFVGSASLKLAIAKELVDFCEASPDPYGVLRLNCAILKWFGPNGAVESEASWTHSGLSKEDQIRSTTTIMRSLGVSKQLGLPSIQATYWDAFLVRGVDFVPPESAQALVIRSQLKAGITVLDQGTPGNPLLYDPSANRLSAEADARKTNVLVQNELSTCLVILQNPYEVPIEIESLHLVTEGVELKTTHNPIVLQPMRLQQVPLSVSPCSTGECKITGCRVKVTACAEQTFPIFAKPWAASPPTLLKNADRSGRLSTQSLKDAWESTNPEHLTVAVNVVEAQPTLIVERSSLLDSKIMLLDGEEQEVKISLKNTSSISASVFEIPVLENILRLQEGSTAEGRLPQPIVVAPGETTSFFFRLTGTAGVSQVLATFYYCSNSPETKYARILRVPFDITVNEALKVQNLEAIALDTDSRDNGSLLLSMDIGNAWPKALSYTCYLSEVKDSNPPHFRSSLHKSVLAPGEIQRVHLSVTRSQAYFDFNDDPEEVRQFLLELLTVSWTWQGRSGKASVTNLVLSPETTEILAGSAIGINVEFIDGEGKTVPSSEHIVTAGHYVTARVRLLNHGPKTDPLIVSWQSANPNSTSSALEEPNLLASGTPFVIIAPLPSGDERTADFSICPLRSGVIEFQLGVKPFRVNSPSRRIQTSRWNGRLTVV